MCILVFLNIPLSPLRPFLRPAVVFGCPAICRPRDDLGTTVTSALLSDPCLRQPQGQASAGVGLRTTPLLSRAHYLLLVPFTYLRVAQVISPEPYWKATHLRSTFSHPPPVCSFSFSYSSQLHFPLSEPVRVRSLRLLELRLVTRCPGHKDPTSALSGYAPAGKPPPTMGNLPGDASPQRLGGCR